MSEITVNELEAKIEEAFEQRVAYEEAKKKSGEEYAKLQQLQDIIKGMFQTLDILSYKAKVGTFSYDEKDSYKVPKDLESKMKFFDFFKDRYGEDALWNNLSIHSRTLNAMVKEEVKAAEDAGVLDFQIPGLEKGEPVVSYTMRKAK